MNWTKLISRPRRHAKRMSQAYRPQAEECEGRCLLSQAVVDFTNESSSAVTIGFRWSPAAQFADYTLQPGHYQYFWTPASSSLNPQVQWANGELGITTYLNAYGGYNVYNGSGTPPVSAAKDYYFVNSTTGSPQFSTTPASSQGALAAEFPGQGVWRFEDSTGWRQISTT